MVVEVSFLNHSMFEMAFRLLGGPRGGGVRGGGGRKYCSEDLDRSKHLFS